MIKVPWKNIPWKLVVRGIIVILLFTYSNLFQYLLVWTFRIDVSRLRGNYGMAVLFSTFSSFIVFIILLLIYRKDLIQDFKIFKKDTLNILNTSLSCWVIGLAVMIVSNYILYFVLKSGGANNERIVQNMISVSPVIMAIDICIFAPFNEEIVFRKTLKDVFSNQKLFIFLSFLIFGYVHVSGMATTYTDWLYMVPYGAVGAAFAAMYAKTNTIFSSMALHSFHNTVLLLLSVLPSII